MNQEVITHFESALHKQGYVFYCPEVLWQAYSQGLLKTRRPGNYFNFVSDRDVRRFSTFFTGQRGDGRDGIDEAPPLPEPTFLLKKEWKTVILYCGLKGIGAGKMTKSRACRSLCVHQDGSVSELLKVPIHLGEGFHPPLPPEKEFTTHSVEYKLKEILGSGYGGYGVRILCYLIIQTDFFSKERVAKIRRRIEDRLRKGTSEDVVRVAKSLGVK